VQVIKVMLVFHQIKKEMCNVMPNFSPGQIKL